MTNAARKRFDEAKLWFFHISKTGGTFLRHYFEKYYYNEIGMSKPRYHNGVRHMTAPLKLTKNMVI